MAASSYSQHVCPTCEGKGFIVKKTSSDIESPRSGDTLKTVEIPRLRSHEIEMTVDRVPLFNIMVVGASGSGDQSLIRMFVSGKIGITSSTIGVSLQCKKVVIEDQSFILKIWNPSGQERFYTISEGYCPRYAHGILIVFDITELKSFQYAQQQLRWIQTSRPDGVPIILVGNKFDLEDQREVSVEEAKSLGLPYVETSAIHQINVNTIFIQLADRVRQRMIVLTPAPAVVPPTPAPEETGFFQSLRSFFRLN